MPNEMGKYEPQKAIIGIIAKNLIFDATFNQNPGINTYAFFRKIPERFVCA